MFLLLQVLCCHSPWTLSLWTHYVWIQVGAACAHNHPPESHHNCQSVAIWSSLCCERCTNRLRRPHQTWTVCLTYTGSIARSPATICLSQGIVFYLFVAASALASQDSLSVPLYVCLLYDMNNYCDIRKLKFQECIRFTCLWMSQLVSYVLSRLIGNCIGDSGWVV
jgi:hypothetical protein